MAMDTNKPVAWAVVDTWTDEELEIARFDTREQALEYCNQIERHTTTDWRFIPMPVRGAFA
jgi:hypothetical protein